MFFIIAAVAFSALPGLLGLGINYTSVLHTGTGYIGYLLRLPIVHCMYVLVELAFVHTKLL